MVSRRGGRYSGHHETEPGLQSPSSASRAFVQHSRRVGSTPLEVIYGILGCLNEEQAGMEHSPVSRCSVFHGFALKGQGESRS